MSKMAGLKLWAMEYNLPTVAKRRKSAGRTPSIPHLRRRGSAAQLVVKGRPFVMLGGEIHNSSSSDLDYMEWVFDRVKALNCNTIIAPVCWELFEPREGKFDFRLVDGLVKGSRKRGLKLVPLWFGTWKNASSDYAPEWVKTDLERFPRAETAPGNRANTVTALSAEGAKADAKAFAAFMRRIKALDGRDQTVIAVQVENETGLLGNSRDRCALAEEAFRGPIPAELARRLETGPESLRDAVKGPWVEAGRRTAGTWSEVFGVVADEVFMAWHTARYVGKVTEAGKKEYPLPMYANAWLCWEGYETPGKYPSGGPVSRMHDIWRIAAPVIDSLAPDIYASDFAGVCADYARGGNPLLIPEARKEPEAPANAFYCLGEHDALCFAPFGIEDVPPGGPLANAYALLASLLPLVAEFNGSGRMRGILKKKPVTEEEEQVFDLGGYELRVRFRARDAGAPPASGLVIAIGPDEYVAAGFGYRIDFGPKEGAGRKADYLSIDEGTFRNGKWIPGRRLNGDERHVAFGPEIGIKRARLYTY